MTRQKWLELQTKHGTDVAVALAEDYVQTERALVSEYAEELYRRRHPSRDDEAIEGDEQNDAWENMHGVE